MTAETPETCTHISQLEPKPSLEDLVKRRKGLRRRKVPKFEINHGEHPRLGKFVLNRSDGETVIAWTVPGSTPRAVSLADLNLKREHELDRLEIGWLIASMYQLDGIHQCKDIADLREVMKVMGWFGRHAAEYRHWALVPAGHMKF